MKFLKNALVLGLLISLSFIFSSCTENIEKDNILEPTRKDVLLDYALFQDYKMTEEEVENSKE